MWPAHLQARWAVLRTFGVWGRLVTATPLGEPVMEVGGDRLVLRREGGFWAAVTCSACAADMAAVDLPPHRAACPGAAGVLRPPLARPSGAAPRAARAGEGKAAATSGSGPSRTLVNHSSARAFGQKQPTPAGDIVLAIAAAVAVSLVVAMILGVLTLP